MGPISSNATRAQSTTPGPAVRIKPKGLGTHSLTRQTPAWQLPRPGPELASQDHTLFLASERQPLLREGGEEINNGPEGTMGDPRNTDAQSINSVSAKENSRRFEDHCLPCTSRMSPFHSPFSHTSSHHSPSCHPHIASHWALQRAAQW